VTTATLAGLSVTECSVQIPAWGCWWADVEVDQAETLSGAVELIVADLALSGTVVDGGPFGGRARYRIAGGAGRWGEEIAAAHYANDAGVKLSKVVGDAAAACGETVGAIAATAVVGPGWTREAGPASRCLSLAAPRGWYVDESGVTQIGQRAAANYDGAAPELEGTDRAAGKLVLGVESIATLLPGVTVNGVTAVDVAHAIAGGKLRTTIWGDSAADTSRLADAIRRIVDALQAANRYRGVWEYRVVSQVGERLNLQAVRASSKLPDLQRVRVRPHPGIRATWKLGSLCLVSFVDADPSRPVVLAGDDPSSSGWLPTDLDLCAADGRVLREGDVLTLTGVQAGAGTAGVTITVTAGPGATDPSRVYA